MDPLKTYDYLVLARERICGWVRPLGADDYAREFPIGAGSLARIFTHMLISEWYYVRRIEGQHVPPYDEWPIRDENPPPFAELETEWTKQAERTRSALAAVRDWSETLDYEVTDEGRRLAVATTPGDIFTQLVLHEVHHRAQAAAILRQLGVKLADLDYNAFMYTRRDIGPA